MRLDLNLWIASGYKHESMNGEEIANVSNITETLKELLFVEIMDYVCGGGDNVELTEEESKDLYYQTCEDLDDSSDFLFCKVLDFLDENNFCYSVNTEEGGIEEINCSQKILFFEFFGGNINIDIGA
jgi:hypothetical protein